MSRFILCLLAAGAFATGLFAQSTPVVTAPPAVASISTGFDFSRGDYGLGTTTEVSSIPVTFGYEQGSWLFEARSSWLRITGPAAIVAGGGSPTRPTAAAESGIGDTNLGITYRTNRGSDVANFAFTGRVKLPTADDARGLGTGATDYSGQFDVYRSFGRVTPFASIGYTWFGNSTVYPLENGAYASAGAHFRSSESTVFSASYNWRHRLVAGGDSGADALVALTHDFSPHWRFTLYALKGFSDASPDNGAGVSLSCRF